MRKLALALSLVATPLWAQTTLPPLQESSFWAQEVDSGNLPPIESRLPQEPLIVDLAAKGRSFGTQGGTLRTLVSRSKDVRQMVVYGYARLVGYQPDYSLDPDILKSVDVEQGRKYHAAPAQRPSLVRRCPLYVG